MAPNNHSDRFIACPARGALGGFNLLDANRPTATNIVEHVRTRSAAQYIARELNAGRLALDPHRPLGSRAQPLRTPAGTAHAAYLAAEWTRNGGRAEVTA